MHFSCFDTTKNTVEPDNSLRPRHFLNLKCPFKPGIVTIQFIIYFINNPVQCEEFHGYYFSGYYQPLCPASFSLLLSQLVLEMLKNSVQLQINPVVSVA